MRSGWLDQSRHRATETSETAAAATEPPTPGHDELITKNGIYLHENLDFTSLLGDKVSEFVYVFSPLRIKGGTGSPGRPVAIT
jgi:kynurenine formamidase